VEISKNLNFTLTR